MLPADQVHRIMRRLSTEKAARYQNEILLPQMAKLMRLPDADATTVREALTDPFNALKVIYGHYAFARRGNNKVDYAQFALEALKRVVDSPDRLDRVFAQQKPEVIWLAFEQVCRENQRKSCEQLNRGMLQGFFELSQQVYFEDGVGNVFDWIQEGVIQTQKVERQFLQIVDIRGIGPKLASLILRDSVWLYHLEDQLEWSDRLFLQPIDAWVRNLADHLTAEVHSATTADWIIAGKLAKTARHANLSGILLNQGIQYFGNYEVRHLSALPDALDYLGRPFESAARQHGNNARKPMHTMPVRKPLF